MAELSSLIASSNAAYNIAKGLTAVYVDEKVRERTSELLTVLISVQTNALAVQTQHQKLLQEKHDLEKKIMQFEGWVKTKGDYELGQLAPGVPAYLRKKLDEVEDSTFWICPYCYDLEKESFLQKEYHSETAGYYFCPGCKTIFRWGRIGRGFQPYDRKLK